MWSKFNLALAAGLAGLLLVSSAGRVQGSLAPSPQAAPLAAVVTPLLQYQGRLSDPRNGQPLNGAYQMSFRLYDAASSARALWSETKEVVAQDGVFSTALGSEAPLSPGLFRGQTLWLGVSVGADPEATPRQQIFPVAYALTLMPGAVVESSGGPALELSHTGGGEALRVQGNLNVSGSLSGGSHSHKGLVLKTTVLAVHCSGVSSFTTSWTKVADLGSFAKTAAASSLEITLNGRVSAQTIAGTGATFQLRLDDRASTVATTGAGLRAADAGNDGLPVSITALFDGASQGNHTVSLWVMGSYGGGTVAYVDAGCWSTDHLVIHEIG